MWMRRLRSSSSFYVIFLGSFTTATTTVRVRSRGSSVVVL